jgi:8-oxo-dGTP pyrophosphatase MutT (NUDIX family)
VFDAHGRYVAWNGGAAKPSRHSAGALLIRMSAFLRHVEACNNHPGLHLLRPWRIEGATVGYLAPAHAAQLAPLPGWQDSAEALDLIAPAAARSAALAAAAGVLGARNRRELFDVRHTPDGPALAVLDRGAIPVFGVIGQGVHVNGLVRRADGLHVWIGWRSKTKAVAPGQLDNLVAGGTPAGLDAFECLVKEAEEEASIPAALARQAVPVARISYVMQVPEGTRRDMMHVFDLDLPEDFTPRPNDNEVERFELWPIGRLFAQVRDAADVKFNVNLALVDLFLREGLIDPGSAEGQTLRQGLRREV